MTLPHFLALKPCPAGLAYVTTAGSVQLAWEQCTRPDWLLWILAAENYPLPVMVEFAQGCAARAEIHAASAAAATTTPRWPYPWPAHYLANRTRAAAVVASTARERATAAAATDAAVMALRLPYWQARGLVHGYAAGAASAAAAAAAYLQAPGAYEAECTWQCARLREAVPVI